MRHITLQMVYVHRGSATQCVQAEAKRYTTNIWLLQSLTSWDQSALLGGMVVNIKFGKDQLEGVKRENFLTLLRAFLARGGMELQVNVVDRATLEDAKAHPEAHRDLLVRIGGYSDYFTRLSPALQQEIIDRTEY